MSYEVIKPGSVSSEYFNFSDMRKFATLPGGEDSWEVIDRTIIEVAQAEFVAVADLQRYGLVTSIDGRAATLYGYRTVSDLDDAQRAMHPDTRGEADRLLTEKVNSPLVITYKDYYLDIREVIESTKFGLPLDTTTAGLAARSVARSVEDLMFNGNYTADGATALGYIPAADAIDVTPIDIDDWSLAATHGDAVLADINELLTRAYGHNHFGPFILYIPTTYQAKMEQDYADGTWNTGMTIKERIMKTSVVDVRISPALATGTNADVALVSMTRQSVSLIEGMPVTNVIWEPDGVKNWNRLFKAMTIMVPQVFIDEGGHIGVVHGQE